MNVAKCLSAQDSSNSTVWQPSPVAFRVVAVTRTRFFISLIRRTLRCIANLILAIGLLLGSAVTVQAQAPQGEWTVSAIPGEVYASREAALAALHQLGGHYALATKLEFVRMTKTNTTYTYGAPNRELEIGPWGDYAIQLGNSGPHATEQAALAAVEANVRTRAGASVPDMQNRHFSCAEASLRLEALRLRTRAISWSD